MFLLSLLPVAYTQKEYDKNGNNVALWRVASRSWRGVRYRRCGRTGSALRARVLCRVLPVENV